MYQCPSNCQERSQHDAGGEARESTKSIVLNSLGTMEMSAPNLMEIHSIFDEKSHSEQKWWIEPSFTVDYNILIPLYDSV